MGIGTFAGLDNEQKWSRFDGYVANTRRMTKGNRMLAITMKFENDDRKKFFNLPSRVQQNLQFARENLTLVEKSLGIATESNRGSYAEAFNRNLQSRQRIVTENQSSKDLLRHQIDYHARVIRSIDRHMKTGTKITSALSAQRRHEMDRLRELIDSYNRDEDMDLETVSNSVDVDDVDEEDEPR